MGSRGLSSSNTGASALDRLRKKSAKYGYTLKSSADSDRRHLTHKKELDAMLEELRMYQKAMGESKDNIRDAGGTIEVVAQSTFNRPTVTGDTDKYGNVRISENWIKHENETLVHEHTHNLVHSLIQKELGYKQGSHEYNQAHTDGIMEKSIQENALKEWKANSIKDIKATMRSFQSDSPMDRSVRASLTKDIEKIKLATVETAVKMSGMRDYALREYAWTPKGVYREIPTVASEMFLKHRYNWSEFKKTGYPYYVLQELMYRLK